MEYWVSITNSLPEIPKGKHGIMVLVAYDVYWDGEESYKVGEMIYNKEKGWLDLQVGRGFCDYLPTHMRVKYWMYKPAPPNKIIEE